MVKFYVNRIKLGRMNLDEVPEKWRKEVGEELKRLGIL